MTPPHLNPFRVSRIEALPFRARDFDWFEVLERLASQRWRGEIVGPHGSGKTTLLLELEQALEARGHRTTRFFLNDTQRVLPSCRQIDRHILLIDGAEQLSRFGWCRLKLRARSMRGLIITAHEPGRLPLLYRCETSPALLNELVAELSPDPEIAARARSLYAEHRGNIRNVFFSLYRHCAARDLARKEVAC